MPLTGITYRLPYAPLASLAITPIAGGSNWVAGTYDFMAIVTDLAASDCAVRESPPIYVTGVVLTAAQGVRMDITWHASHASPVRCQLYAKKTSATAGNWFCINIASGNYNGLAYPAVTFDFLNYAFRYQFSNMAIIPNPPAVMPYGLDNTQGAGVIEIGATGTSYTLKQIFDDMEASGYANTAYAKYNLANTFVGCWSIKTVTGATGSLNMSGWTLWMYGIRFDKTTYTPYTLSGYTESTNLSVYKASGATVQMYLYNSVLFGTTLSPGIQGISPVYTGQLQVNYDATTRLTNCRVHSSYPYLQFPSTYSGTVLNGSWVIVFLNSATYTTPVTTLCPFRVYYIHWQTNFRDAITQTITGGADFGYYLTSSNPTSVEQNMLDCKFQYYTSNTNPTVLSDNDYPQKIFWHGIQLGNYQMLNIRHSINYIIDNEDGDAISGATVKIYDKDNTLIETATTDVNGAITEIKLITKKIQYISGSASVPVTGVENEYHTVNRRYPFTIIVSKTGYETYTTILSTIEDKIDTIITLKAAIPAKKTIEGTDIQVLQPELGSSSRLLEL